MSEQVQVGDVWRRKANGTHYWIKQVTRGVFGFARLVPVQERDGVWVKGVAGRRVCNKGEGAIRFEMERVATGVTPDGGA